MIIFSCYIHTNNILYTVEIYTPCDIESQTLTSSFQLIPKAEQTGQGKLRHQANVTSDEFLNTARHSKPHQKAETKEKKNNICTSRQPRSRRENNRDTVFIQRRLIVSEAAAAATWRQRPATVEEGEGRGRGKRGTEGRKCSWYTGGGGA